MSDQSSRLKSRKFVVHLHEYVTQALCLYDHSNIGISKTYIAVTATVYMMLKVELFILHVLHMFLYSTWDYP